jgi:hypothetical protein
MDNRNVSAVDPKDNNVASADRLVAIVGQKEKITAKEGRLHTSTRQRTCSRSVRGASSQTKTNLNTTTIGLSLPVTTISPFQIISAVDMIMPKLSI